MPDLRKTYKRAVQASKDKRRYFLRHNKRHSHLVRKQRQQRAEKLRLDTKPFEIGTVQVGQAAISVLHLQQSALRLFPSPV